MDKLLEKKITRRRLVLSGSNPPDLKNTAVNAGLILAFTTGMLYLYGYSYLSGYYQYFRVPLHLINPDFYTVLIYGFIQNIVILVIASGLLCILPTLASIVNDLRRFNWLDKVARGFNDEIFKGKFIYGLVLIVFIAVLVESLISAGSDGLKRAKSYATDYGPLVKVEYNKTYSKERKQLPLFGYLHHNATQYILFDAYAEKETIPAVYIVEAKDIKQLTIIGSVRAIKDEEKMSTLKSVN